MQQKDYASQIHRCFRCGWCKFTSNYSDFNCPPYKRFRFETYSTSGRLWLIRAWLKGEMQWSERLAQILYTCTTCKNCVERCPMGFANDIVDWIVAARADMVEQGKIPARVARFFEAVHGYGNPLKLLRSDRVAWADGVKRYSPGDEFLLYIGCLASYDENAQSMARSFVKILDASGISYGILGEEEECCGSEVRMLGETGLFELLADKNSRKFKELRVDKVVALCPHGYNALKNYYPSFGSDFKVYHYTELLSDLITRGKVKLLPKEMKITYHDPCFLGRYNQIYEEPRSILNSIPGATTVEMKRNKEDAFCCGGGSGNFVIDLLAGGEESPSRVRVKEAYATGADTLAVACPGCLTMLADAVKAEGLQDNLSVKDISQIVVECLG